MRGLALMFAALASFYGYANAGNVPSITSPNTASVDENSVDGTIVLAITTSNPPNMNLMVTGQTPETSPRKFAINGANLVVNDEINHENMAEYMVDIKATDPNDMTMSATQTITVAVTDVNEAPLFPVPMYDVPLPTTAFAEGTTLLTISAMDPEGDDLAYSIANCTDGCQLLVIENQNNSGIIKVAPNNNLAGSLPILFGVTATDNGVPSLNKTIPVQLRQRVNSSSIKLTVGLNFAFILLCHLML